MAPNLTVQNFVSEQRIEPNTVVMVRSLVGVRVAEDAGAVRAEVGVACVRVPREVVVDESLEMARDDRMPISVQSTAEPAHIMSILGIAFLQYP